MTSLSGQQAFATPCVDNPCFVLILACCFAMKLDSTTGQLNCNWDVLPEVLTFIWYCFLRILPAFYASCLLRNLELNCWLTPPCLPHSPAFNLAQALQLVRAHVAQAFQTAIYNGHSSKCASSPPCALRTAFHCKVSAEVVPILYADF